ncbi:MAG: divalent-cation tolerance protein CutA [Methanoregulaceae archaeon]|jgi:periplasmic divalent cation tolerance protein|nr:divalent-cation tolerance protein CutA [Methanoregulaceae archaeon]
MNKYIVVLVTTADKEEAQRISQILLENKKAVCINIIPNVNSSYWWEGKIEKEKEYLLIVKTTGTKFDELVKLVKECHSYKVPEIIAIPMIAGNPDYLDWIDETIQ